MDKRKQMPEDPAVQSRSVVRYPLLWLIAAVLVVYAPTISFDFTQLDDSIFIQDKKAYNEDLSNLIHSFHQGVFNETGDTYYRPLFLNSMILNSQISGQDIGGYHVVNILLHLMSVVLLFRLMKQIGIDRLHAFLLCLLFAVHPVLTQAVTWIPGRNDTLLAVFILLFLNSSIMYINREKLPSLLSAALFLCCAFFTKETALLAPAAAFVLLVIMLKVPWKSRLMIMQYGMWLLILLFYAGIKSMASLNAMDLDLARITGDFAGRLPLIVQYTGKIFFPFNLSVFPMQEDTGYYYGIMAMLLLVLLVVITKEKNWRVMAGGALIFLIFLVPALLIPRGLNEQCFEHRLYLPVMGMSLLLSQTVLFKNRLREPVLLFFVVALAAFFALQNYRHQEHFKNSVVFWKQAAETSPHSAYALMMYGARVDGRANKYALIRRAYAINPKEKYLNYYYGLMLQEQDSLDQAIEHLLDEQQRSDYYECDFHLARIYFTRQQLPLSAQHLERYLTRDPRNEAANSNLLLLYIDTRQREKAQAQFGKMQERGIAVAPLLLKQLQEL